jgi:hypothetical protein
VCVRVQSYEVEREEAHVTREQRKDQSEMERKVGKVRRK